MKIKSLIVLFVLCSAMTLRAQESKNSTSVSNYGLPQMKDFDRWSAGITIGTSHLLGDLLSGPQNNNRFLDNANINPAVGLQVHHQLTHSIGIRGRGVISRFTGGDEEYLDSLTLQPISFSSAAGNELWTEDFESPMYEASLEMTYNFGNISFLNRNKNFHMVATLGLGLFNFDTEITGRKKPKKSTDPLDPIQTIRSSGKITEIMVPVSLGFKYKIKKIDVGMAFEYRKTFTDKVDATVKTFSEYDNYLLATVGVNYTFGKKNKPMEWVNPMEIVYNDMADMKEKIDILSGDKDKDGVSDLFDKDNTTPEGTKVYGDGTMVDTDGDGVADGKDADPFTPKGAKVDANGQETDTDGDGVADSKDLEPSTASGSLVNFQGVTIAKPGDFGKDGAGLNGLSGTSGKNGVGYLPSVFFDLGSATIKSNFHDRILVIARVLQANPALKVRITGNCDITGSEEENIRLGQKRADNVKEHLIKNYNIDGSRLITETKGKKEPMANKLNPMNRRVDFSVE